MRYLRFAGIIVFVSAMTIARKLYGDWIAAWFFGAVGVVGALGIGVYYYQRGRAARALASMSDADREEVLVELEENPIRAALVADLGIEAPRMPLRGARETFRYPASVNRTTRWTMWATAWIAAVSATLVVSDLLRGTHVAIGRPPQWAEIVLFIAAFTSGAAMLRWQLPETQGELAITDDDLTWSAPGRAARRIAWRDVTRVRLGTGQYALDVRSRTQRIRLNTSLHDAGRAVNLIATRVPPHVTKEVD